MAPHAVESLDGADTVISRPAVTTNGASTNGHGISQSAVIPSWRSEPKSQYVRATPVEELHDLICVGFGPASLAIAVAIHDALETGTLAEAPRVLFLEKQQTFAWHAGMLLRGARMQISFIKDMASLRDPRSNFTFLNYLHKNNRLVEFTNLNTFLPARVEYEDYLRWCAKHFTDVVRYSTEVLAVHPATKGSAGCAAAVDTFDVVARSLRTGAETTYRSRNVILAVGGQASIPRSMPAEHPKVIHSSQYAHLVPEILSDTSAAYRVAVVGAGQSAAEIFSNIQALYPNSRTWMVMRAEFLKPSDDSPFVNSIFNPEFVDSLYPRSATARHNLIADARATNYGVVRLELIEKLYELMYHQRRELGTDERQWPHRIMGGRRVVGCDPEGDKLRLRVRRASLFEESVNISDEDLNLSPDGEGEEEEFEADLVIAATGYKRDAHVDLLRSLWVYLPERKQAANSADGHFKSSKPVFDHWEVQLETEKDIVSTRTLEVGRDYRVQFAPGSVAPGSGVWLQGCCEGTHGLSDTLLSILSTRSGDIVNSIFQPTN